MVEHHGSFVWYELMTTDMAAAATFYANVVGWGAQDASPPDLAYTLVTTGSCPGMGRSLDCKVWPPPFDEDHDRKIGDGGGM